MCKYVHGVGIGIGMAHTDCPSWEHEEHFDDNIRSDRGSFGDCERLKPTKVRVSKTISMSFSLHKLSIPKRGLRFKQVLFLKKH